MDVVKSLESLNEEIRDTLPWTTPAPGGNTVIKKYHLLSFTDSSSRKS